MAARKSSHRTMFLIVSSGSPLALIASSLRSTSKKPFCPMTRSLHPPITACGHRVRFVGTWREEFFEGPKSKKTSILDAFQFSELTCPPNMQLPKAAFVTKDENAQEAASVISRFLYWHEFQ